MISATPEHIKTAEDNLKNVYPMAASDVAPALKKAIESRPEIICLATGKTLDIEFANIVLTEADITALVAYLSSLK